MIRHTEYHTWLNEVIRLGAKRLLKEVTPNSLYNMTYAEARVDRVVGNWSTTNKIGWTYDPSMPLNKRYRKFNSVNL